MSPIKLCGRVPDSNKVYGDGIGYVVQLIPQVSVANMTLKEAQP